MTTRAEPRLAVVIPHYNDPVRLRHCLEALAPQLAAHPEAEAVVVDNASPLDLGPLAAEFPSVRFVVEPEKGAAAARNRGVAETAAPHLAFLDSDCVPAPDWLATALSLSGEDALNGGRVDTFDETPPPKSGAEAFETVFAFHQRSYVEKKGFSVTANLLASRRVFEIAGPMVPGMAEDVDWCRAATAKGIPLHYADALAVVHPTRQDWPALARKWRRTTSEMFRSNGTGAAARLRWGSRALAVAGSALPHSLKVTCSPVLSPLEKWRALGTLWRLRLVRARWMLRQALTGSAG
ncbi:glycosyltransferase family 2 protein [Mangrovicoccus sp. HB161399]|uniref:glycosyltransferase family 2 protein n=1 Tax=Mangrovicoccus sp. HB161399 TaxID=2720392 RepID=UPI0015551F80|nr:glycosyltransferase [Mangrovicoccus sp. HB161399]